MINFRLVGKNLAISLEKMGYDEFNKTIRVLKDNGFRYNSATQQWLGALHKKDSIKEILEDFSLIDDKVPQSVIDNILGENKRQFFENPRRIPDYSLMNFPPIEGKSPYENFQRKAISNGINCSCRAFFYGMGSGKSYILSAIIAHRVYKYHDCSKVLIVTTNIGVRNLYYELFKFIKDLDQSKVIIADKNNRNPFDNKDTDIIVTSYSSIRLISDFYKKQYKISTKKPRKPFLPLNEWANGGKLLLALDESHCVASTTSIQSNIIATHAPCFTYRYLFSGTPADKPEKQWQQFNILDPYLVYNLSFTEWKNKMAYLGDRFSAFSVREWKEDELKKQNERFLSSYGEYYKTTDLVDLPNYNEQLIYIEMNPVHRKLYEEVITQDLKDRNTVREIVNRFPYMLLAGDDPSLLEKHTEKFDDKLVKMINSFNDKYLEKYNALEDIINDNPDDKIIVWIIHPTTAKRICDRFSKLNPICIVGGIEQDEKFKLVEEFKKGNHKLLVANITTLSTSVTITEATISVYFERAFNYTEYSQSQNRNYRIGQDKDVKSYILIYNNSLDVLLNKNLESKGTLVNGLCSKDFLSQEDWKKIFNCKESDRF